MLLQLHTFSFEVSWLKELDVSVAISTSIITYNNTHSVRATRCTRMVSRRHLPAEGRVGICGRLTGTGTSFSPIILFSPVSIIPPILYTQPFIYHQNYVTLPTDSAIKWHTHTQSQNSDRNLMSTSTNMVNRLNKQLYADQTSCWNVQYHNTTQLHTDRNITAQ